MAQVQQWNRLTAVLTPIWSPILLLVAVKQFFRTLPTAPLFTFDLPLVAIAVAVGVVAAVLVFFTTQWTEQPKYHWVGSHSDLT